MRMKKNIFIILVAILFILLLLYFFDKRIAILNKEYVNMEENIHIEYPYFNNSTIEIIWKVQYRYHGYSIRPVCP